MNGVLGLVGPKGAVGLTRCRSCRSESSWGHAGGGLACTAATGPACFLPRLGQGKQRPWRPRELHLMQDRWAHTGPFRNPCPHLCGPRCTSCLAASLSAFSPAPVFPVLQAAFQEFCSDKGPCGCWSWEKRSLGDTGWQLCAGRTPGVRVDRCPHQEEPQRKGRSRGLKSKDCIWRKTLGEAHSASLHLCLLIHKMAMNLPFSGC